jgi:hypothetical protein
VKSVRIIDIATGIQGPEVGPVTEALSWIQSIVEPWFNTLIQFTDPLGSNVKRLDPMLTCTFVMAPK